MTTNQISAKRRKRLMAGKHFTLLLVVILLSVMAVGQDDGSSSGDTGNSPDCGGSSCDAPPACLPENGCFKVTTWGNFPGVPTLVDPSFDLDLGDPGSGDSMGGSSFGFPSGLFGNPGGKGLLWRGYLKPFTSVAWPTPKRSLAYRLGEALGRWERGVRDYLNQPCPDCVIPPSQFAGLFNPFPSPPLIRLAKPLSDYPAGQGFTGVYDASTGQIMLVPSTANPQIPPGWVARNGGHAAVSQALGGDAAEHYGFAAIIQENGSLQLTWRSGVLNSAYPGAEVPMGIRPAIVQEVEALTDAAILP
jgi:hypothetical protein